MAYEENPGSVRKTQSLCEPQSLCGPQDLHTNPTSLGRSGKKYSNSAPVLWHGHLSSGELNRMNQKTVKICLFLLLCSCSSPRSETRAEEDGVGSCLEPSPDP